MSEKDRPDVGSGGPDRPPVPQDARTRRLEPVSFDETLRLDADTIREAMQEGENAPSPEGWAPASRPRPANRNAEPPSEAEEKAAEEKTAKDEEKPPYPPIVDAKTPETEALKAAVIAMMKTVFDPEIPVNIYEMGMVYDVAVDQAGRCLVTMTLTSPSCPVAGTLPGEVEAKIGGVDGVAEARVVLVWDPPWTPDMMSESARLELNMM